MLSAIKKVTKGLIINSDSDELPFDTGGVSVKSFMVEVAKGNVPGHSALNKFGQNGSVTTAGVPEDIWSYSGLYGFYPTTAQAMELVSDNAADAAAGTGAWSVQIYGLDSNWDEITETVTPTGTTAVALSNTYIRMYRAVVLTAGTNETNVGNISIQISGGGTVGAYIEEEDGQTQQAIYTIPNGKTGYVTKGYVGISDGGNAVSRESAVFKWKSRLNTISDGAWATKGQVECINDGNTTWQYEYGIPTGPLPEKTDVRIEATDVSATLGVVGGLDILLVDDGY